MQEALGLKVSQFLGIMGDETPDPLAQQESISLARAHIRRLLSRVDAGEFV